MGAVEVLISGPKVLELIIPGVGTVIITATPHAEVTEDGNVTVSVSRIDAEWGWRAESAEHSGAKRSLA